MKVAIEASALTKTYGATRVVAGLDLHVEAGQVFGFVGPNGAGKTTTIRMLLALQKPSEGHAEVLGLDPQRDSVEIHRGIGYLPGELELYPRLTGHQHIDWFARARRQHDPALAKRLAERFNAVLDRPAKELSTGNKQKIGLIIAFMHRPELLILDEPTSGLDPLMKQEFERLARETVSEGRTLFLSSHDLDEVQRLADHIAIIRSGKLVTTDSVDNLRRNAPRRVQVQFRQHVDHSLFADVAGVTVTAAEGTRLALQVTGEIGPLLKLIAEHDPVDLVARPADLEELFLELYREPPARESADAD